MFELKKTIEEIRINLNHLLMVRNNLLDPEVIYVSQELDKFLNRYYAIQSE